MTRYIDIENRQEWSKNHSNEALPDAVVEDDGSSPFFHAIPEGMKLIWNPLPELVQISVEELSERATEANIARFRASRDGAVSAIKVTVNGNVFDGDEVAQGRMSRAIMAANKLQSPVIPIWKLADNSVTRDLPVGDLEMALALSVVAMAQVWV